MALLLSVSGGAIAKIADKDEVSVAVVTGGPVTNTGPGEEDEGFTSTEIPLSNATFTQQAGEVVLISVVSDIVRVGPPEGEEHCDIEVNVIADHPVMNELYLSTVLLARRGDPGLFADSDALTAPAVAREVTLVASLQQYEVGGEFEGEEDVTCDDEDATASVRISLVTLRD